MQNLQHVDTPEAAGLCPRRWEHTCQLASRWCRSGELPALGLLVGHHGRTLGTRLFGRQRLDDDCGSIRPDARFLVASITKPIVAMASLLLVERGQMLLGDRVSQHLEEFNRSGKNGLRIRHLLTHTSGLPDMLPDNQLLRERHAPIADFVAATRDVDLAFAPGRGVQYQSMGFAVLSEIVNRLSGLDYREFLRRELFEPLGMHDTHLGAPDSWFEPGSGELARIAELRIPEIQQGTDWGWNSQYWRQLGAPWGGLLTTPEDLGRLAQMMLNQGRLDGVQILSPATVAAATCNQLAGMADIPESDRRCRPWGLGWRLFWPALSANFGDLLGPRTYGHWGATGTALWIDPDREAFAVILSTLPQEPHGRYLAQLSNAIAASLS